MTPREKTVDQTSRPVRTRLAPAARRAAILDVATQLVERKRFVDAITVEEIAQDAGVSAGLIYHYFGTKDDLALAVVQHAIDGFLLALATPGETPPDATPRGALDETLKRYLQFVIERPAGFARVIGRAGVPDERAAKLIADAREVAHQAVLAVLGLSSPSTEQDLAVWGWIGAVEAVSTRWMENPSMERDELRALLLSLLPQIALH